MKIAFIIHMKMLRPKERKNFKNKLKNAFSLFLCEKNLGRDQIKQQHFHTFKNNLSNFIYLFFPYKLEK